MIPNILTNPFSLRLIRFDPAHVVGRSQERLQLLWGVTDSTPKSFAISGGAKGGKTTLLRYLCDPTGARAKDGQMLKAIGATEAARRLSEIDFLYVDFDHVAHGPDILPELADRVSRHLGQRIGELQPSVYLRQTIQTLGQRLVICMDHLDHAIIDLPMADELLLRSFTDSVALILVTEQSLGDLKEAKKIRSPLHNVCLPRQIGPFADHEARELVESAYSEVSQKVSTQELNLILSAGGHHPYLLILAAEFIWNLQHYNPDWRDAIVADKRPHLIDEVVTQMVAAPSVLHALDLLWERLADVEKAVLMHVAYSLPLESAAESLAMSALVQRGLIRQPVPDGQHQFDSRVLYQYARQQRQGQLSGQQVMLQRVAETLPPRESQLLAYLMTRPNQVCKFQELADAVWQSGTVTRKSQEASVHRLRSQIREVLGTDWEFIKSQYGQGYKYTPKPND